MAASRPLNDVQIVRLAEAITFSNMQSIGVLYFGMDWEDLENLKAKHREDVIAFNRDVIKKWAYKNRSSQQVKIGISLSAFGPTSPVIILGGTAIYFTY